MKFIFGFALLLGLTGCANGLPKGPRGKALLTLMQQCVAVGGEPTLVAHRALTTDSVMCTVTIE